jgi:hypothetical protein
MLIMVHCVHAFMKGTKTCDRFFVEIQKIKSVRPVCLNLNITSITHITFIFNTVFWISLKGPSGQKRSA